jgi:hypothetical protein
LKDWLNFDDDAVSALLDQGALQDESAAL